MRFIVLASIITILAYGAASYSIKLPIQHIVEAKNLAKSSDININSNDNKSISTSITNIDSVHSSTHRSSIKETEETSLGTNDNQTNSNRIFINSHRVNSEGHEVKYDEINADASPDKSSWSKVKLMAVRVVENIDKTLKKKKLPTQAPGSNTNTPDDNSKTVNANPPPPVINDTNQTSDKVDADKIPCSSVDYIKLSAQKINDAYYKDGTYLLTTDEPAFQNNGMTWLVSVGGIIADSSEEAISKAIIVAEETSQLKTEYAELAKNFESPFDFYTCNYGPGNIIAIGVSSKALIEH